jgi:hypothetical protein
MAIEELMRMPRPLKPMTEDFAPQRRPRPLWQGPPNGSR